MKMRKILVGLVCMCSSTLIARPLLAQDSAGDAAKGAMNQATEAAKQKAQEAGQQAADEAKKKVGEWAQQGDKKMSPEDQKAMEAMMKAGQPGPEHQYLKSMEGTWTAVVKSRMTPDAPWEESKGTMENKMILDGRWLQSNFTGEMGGQKFTGLGFMGYDNMTKKYISTWTDSMSTGMMVSYGTSDAAHKSFTLSGESMCPMSGKMETCKTITTLEGAGKYTMKMVSPAPDGKGEFECMNITYTR